MFFGKIKFFLLINFEQRKMEKNAKHHSIPLKTLSSKNHRNICILAPKGQFENLSLGQVKGPDLINDPGRSYRISVDASWRDQHSDTSPTALHQFSEELLTKMVSWPSMTSYWLTSVSGHIKICRTILPNVSFVRMATITTVLTSFVPVSESAEISQFAHLWQLVKLGQLIMRADCAVWIVRHWIISATECRLASVHWH